MGEDVNSVSPTLGFIIKTIDYEGYGHHCHLLYHLVNSFQDISLTSVSLMGGLSTPYVCLCFLGDVGGQKTLRSYWRNYFEKTDALIWVVDATDRLRIEDCKEELHGLLQEEVGAYALHSYTFANVISRGSQVQACLYLRIKRM